MHHLKDISTRSPKHLDKETGKQELANILKELDELQNLLYASSTDSILIVIQGMDASGKDGLTKDVFTSMNPQGVDVTSFKVPTALEDAHDFLWRVHTHAPSKGMIQVFNRSHYESILVTRVHNMIDDKTAKKRMQAINDFERLLTEHNNTHILKFYLHVSPERQQERLKARLSDPRKMWKYNANDQQEAKLWDQYMDAYEDAFKNCNEIPWHIIPADQNWYKSLLVAARLRDTLKGLGLKYPGLKK